jgi:hypothetical protein
MLSSCVPVGAITALLCQKIRTQLLVWQYLFQHAAEHSSLVVCGECVAIARDMAMTLNCGALPMLF